MQAQAQPLHVAATRADQRHVPSSAASSGRCIGRHDVVARSCEARRRIVLRAQEGENVLGSYAQLHSASDPMGSKMAERSCEWSSATVVSNRAESIDGTIRSLVLSVADPIAKGALRRSSSGRPASHDWLTRYSGPGQFVAIRTNGNGQVRAQQRTHTITSPPYQARSQSADLDAVIIEVLLDRNGSEQDKVLAAMGPGDQVEVSHPIGSGFQSLFATDTGGLAGALEARRPLVMVAVGSRGIAAMRSCIEWTPVQAHSTSTPVTLFYVADSQPNAAYIKDWDTWRDSGAVVNVLFTSNFSNDARPTEQVVSQMLSNAVLGGELGVRGNIRAQPRDTAVLFAGIQGEMAVQLLRKMQAAGFDRDSFLFCEFF